MKKAFLVIVLLIFMSISLMSSEWWVPPKNATIGVVITEEVFEEPKPQVVVQIVRQIPDPQVQTAIINHLIKNGYNVKIFTISENELSLALGNPTQASAIAKKQGIDILIIGESFAEYTGTLGGMEVYRAVTELKGISTYDNKVLFSRSCGGIGRDISKSAAAKMSLRDAGELMSGLIFPDNKIRLALVTNLVVQENFPQQFSQRFMGWLWLTEMQERIINELPNNYRNRIQMLMIPTTADINISQNRADILKQNPQFLIFFEITSIKANWRPSFQVSYTIEIKYEIISQERQEVLETGRIYKERNANEPLFYSTNATIENYYNSVFRDFLRDVANEVYIKSGKKIMDLIDTAAPLRITNIPVTNSNTVTTVIVKPTENASYIANVKLLNGENYSGQIEGQLVIQNLANNQTLHLAFENMSEMELVNGDIFRVSMKDGTIVKGKIILPNMTIKTQSAGSVIINTLSINKVEFRAKTN